MTEQFTCSWSEQRGPLKSTSSSLPTTSCDSCRSHESSGRGLPSFRCRPTSKLLALASTPSIVFIWSRSLTWGKTGHTPLAVDISFLPSALREKKIGHSITSMSLSAVKREGKRMRRWRTLIGIELVDVFRSLRVFSVGIQRRVPQRRSHHQSYVGHISSSFQQQQPQQQQPFHHS